MDTVPAFPSFLAPDHPPCPLSHARTVILPVPYERTTSYGKGTAKGPNAILRASSFLETFDEELKTEPCESNLGTAPSVAFSSNEDEESCMDKIQRAAEVLVQKGKKVIALGGEHSISAPLAQAHAKHYKNLTVLQLDAHADLRDSYEGSRRSHASVMRRITEKLPAVQVGIRSLSKEEHDEITGLNTSVFYMHEIVNREEWMDVAVEKLSENVYVTIDVDVLDPSVMPSTGTPEPGGMDWYTLVGFLRKVSESRNIVGADVVEFAPIDKLHAPDATAAKLVYKLVGMMAD